MNKIEKIEKMNKIEKVDKWSKKQEKNSICRSAMRCSRLKIVYRKTYQHDKPTQNERDAKFHFRPLG